MSPVTGFEMLNFLQWMTSWHPEVLRLRDIPTERLMQLANEFEHGKLSRDSYRKDQWREGFRILFETENDWEGYKSARNTLRRIGLTKEMSPVTGYDMLNFLRWLTSEHPEVQELSNLPERNLLQLVDEFEEGRLNRDSNLKNQWRTGFKTLFTTQDDWQGYDQARYALKRLKKG